MSLIENVMFIHTIDRERFVLSIGPNHIDFAGCGATKTEMQARVVARLIALRWRDHTNELSFPGIDRHDRPDGVAPGGSGPDG